MAIRDDLFDQSYYDMYIDRLEAPDVRVVVSLSSGNASAVAGELALKAYGSDRVDLVFADTLIEDADNYRFLNAIEERWGKKITRLVDGRDPYQVAEDAQIIPNQSIAQCTIRLKLDLIQQYVEELQVDGTVVIVVIGFDHKDAMPRGQKPEGRLPSPRERWAERNVIVWYPLLEKRPFAFYRPLAVPPQSPIVFDAYQVVKSWGIEPPEMYRTGHSHANCSGVCVKQGQTDWRRTLIHNRALYLRVEEWERNMMIWQLTKRLRQLLIALNTKQYGRVADIDFERHTIMMDRRGGERQSISLEEFRIEHEKADEHQLRMFAMLDDMGSVCGVECMAA